LGALAGKMSGSSLIFNPEAFKDMIQRTVIRDEDINLNPGPGSRPTIFGIPYLVSEAIPKTIQRQFRFPRSKRVRIQKKWRTNPHNFKTLEVVAVLLDANGRLIDRFVTREENPGKLG
jgi:hypothetical protein